MPSSPGSVGLARAHPVTKTQAMEPSRQTWSSYGPPYPLGRWSSATHSTLPQRPGMAARVTDFGSTIVSCFGHGFSPVSSSFCRGPREDLQSSGSASIGTRGYRTILRTCRQTTRFTCRLDDTFIPAPSNPKPMYVATKEKRQVRGRMNEVNSSDCTRITWAETRVVHQSCRARVVFVVVRYCLLYTSPSPRDS